MNPVGRSWMRRVMVLAAALTLVSWVAAVQAAPKGKTPPKKKGPKLEQVIGEVAKTATKKGKLTGVSIKKDDKTVVQVVLDKTGMKMGKAMAGKRIEAMGKLSVRGKGKAKKTWIKVSSFKEAPAPAPADEPADEEGGGDEGAGGEEGGGGEDME